MLQSMEKRENALREALDQNEKDTKQWQMFIEENETAINNMDMFSKKLTVDVMVPFGKKAFFPGRIIHTNEVLVAHYEGYFSECSAYVATKICNQRIDNAKKRLKEIEAEKDLFQNKLEKPYVDGVLPSSEQQEIIEDYNEESEKVWREQHRQRVKEAKLKEKKEREQIMSQCTEHDDFQSLLGEDERSISELNDELAELETEYAKETNDLLNKLISGEMKPVSSKKRIAHVSTVQADLTVKSNESKAEVRLTKDLGSDHILKSENDKSELVDDDYSEIPQEIYLVEEQAGFLPENDRAGFYQYQLQIINQKLAKLKFSNEKELEEKLHLFKVRDYLEELLEEASPVDTDLETNDVEKKETETTTNCPKRRVSFANDNQMLEFQKNETVAQMLPNISLSEKAPKRDIIRLDEDIYKPVTVEKENDPQIKRKTILEKVEENLKNNSLEDADLVTKIIDSNANHVQTLHISFKHSPNIRTCSNIKENGVFTNPADFYNLFNQTELNNDTDLNFYLKESDREKAYVDVRSQFLTPKNEIVKDNLNHSKSILKNKTVSNCEKHVLEKDSECKVIEEKRKEYTNEEEYLSAYNKVMGEVIENPTIPDPLPEEKFVDMHAPKKRISRFKQMRKETRSINT